MYKTRSYLVKENCWSSLMRKIDIFGDPVQWYIENNTHFGTIIGGYRSFTVIFICITFLIYSFVTLFTNRVGSFLYYDVILPNITDSNISYFDTLEIFFFVKGAKNNVVNIDPNLARAYLQQTFYFTSTNQSSNQILTQQGVANHELNSDENNNNEDLDNNENIITQTIAYPFEVCDYDYYKETLKFSTEIQNKLFNQIYCINRTKYENDQLNFVLSPSLLLGLKGHALEFQIKQICLLSNNCTTADNITYSLLQAKMKELQIFIKGKIPNPLDINYPLSDSVSSIAISKPTSIYFKNYEIATDSSIIPSISLKYHHFQSFEKTELNQEELSSSDLKFTLLLSNTYSFIHRKYQKIDSLLGGFIAIFNILIGIGKFFTFLFCSFDNDFFIYNHTIGKRINYNGSDKITDTKLYQVNSQREKYFSSKLRLHLPNNNPLTIIHDYNNLSFNNNLPPINNNSNSRSNVKQYNEKPSEIFLGLVQNKKGKKNLSIINNKHHNNNEYMIEKRNTNKLKTNRCRHLVTMIIYYLPSCRKSKDQKSESIISKINFVHQLFDVSVYINSIFDVIKLKQLLLSKNQIRLFDTIKLPFKSLNKELNDISSNSNVSISFEERERIQKQLKFEDSNNFFNGILCNKA